MKISKSFIATAVIAVLPLVAFGGDKDKTPAGAHGHRCKRAIRHARCQPRRAHLARRSGYRLEDRVLDRRQEWRRISRQQRVFESRHVERQLDAGKDPQVIRQGLEMPVQPLGCAGSLLGAAYGSALKLCGRRETMHS